AEVDESLHSGEDAGPYVRRLARAKAAAVECGLKNVVLGADTVVVVDGRILGKPADREDACRMLTLLSGREHEVVTGICLRSEVEAIDDHETTRVRFVPLTRADIENYVASGEPMDKAGGYAVQGLASKFIDRLEGCYFNVVGLPVAKVYALLRRFSQAASGDAAL
ncbi:MAG TPA: Maf family protein, partial [Bryobacteraceae bacterium]